MLRAFGKIMVTGLVTILPVILTIYLLYWLAVSSEQLMGSLLRYLLPEVLYFPGLGMISGIVVVFLVGLLMKAYFVRQLFAMGESILYQLPFVKSIYRALRDFLDFLSPHKKESLGKAVSVTINGMKLVGFITQEDASKLPETFRDDDHVLVYLPMSYMIGGYTLLIPRANVEYLDMSMEQAMQFALTAGITGKAQK